MAKVAQRSRFLDYKLHKAYVKFRRDLEIPKEFIANNHPELFKIISEIFRVIAKNIHEREAGVCIEEFGYFFNWLIPKRMFGEKIRQGESRGHYKNHHTNQGIYTITYIPSEYFEGWAMDTHFASSIKKEVSRRLKEGFRYKGYPYSLKSFYKR